MFATVMLINEESQGLIDAGVSKPPFAHRFGECQVSRVDIPEAVEAYDEDTRQRSLRACRARGEASTTGTGADGRSISPDKA